MTIPIVLLFAAQLVVPGYLFYGLLKSPGNSQYGWLLKVIHAGGFLLLIILIGRWDWLGYPVRYLLAVLFLVVAGISYRKARNLPRMVGEGRRRWIPNPMQLVELAVIFAGLAFTVRGNFHRDGAVELDFPLQDGRYYVMHGGSSVIVNYHNSNAAQRFAYDIGELNRYGFRARGVYPSELDRYVIYGETIYSPCEGTVTESMDGLADNIPPETNREQIAGNHVVLACRDAKILLAHMKNGSVQVEPGQAVRSGQPLGEVGNSGNTTEPHLHIHAVQGEASDVLTGRGAPIEFGGRFAVRNDLFVR